LGQIGNQQLWWFDLRMTKNTREHFSFISLQLDYWDSPWQNRHAFVWELSKLYPVFFLSPPFYIADILQGATGRKTRLRGLSEVKDDLYSYVPPVYLPYNFKFPRIDRAIQGIRHATIRRKLKSLGFERPILYVWHPRFADMLGEFRESFVIYHKYDNYAGYFGAGNARNIREEQLLERADLVMVTSQGLLDMHKKDRDDIYLVPNGVDFEFFSRTLTEAVQVPADLEQIPGPRIGYVGVINEKVDFELLTYLCEENPDWSIVLVGPVKVRQEGYIEKYNRLRECPNCYFLGQKEGRDVPAYLKGMDVCMMCYLVNDWTYYGYPLKMHEYLACGKPSVAADLPAIREFSNVIKIAKSREEWLGDITGLLESKDDASLIRARLDVARDNSWQQRVLQVMELIRMKTENQ